MRSNRYLFTFLMLIVVGTSLSQTSELTYQGKLVASGTAANTPHDFEFRLCSSETDCVTPLEVKQRLGVLVSNGVFTVQLDFDAANFNGADRWLEIAVRSAGAGTFAPLAPRQRVTSAPYSIKSSNSETAITATNTAQLGGINANQYVLTTDPRMSDPRIPLAGSADYIQAQPGPTQQPGASFNIGGSGTIGGTLSLGTGGTAAAPSMTFSGDTDTGIFRSAADTLNFSTAGVSRVHIAPDGKIGIGTTTPESRLHVVGTGPAAAIFADSTSTPGSGPGGFFAGGNIGAFATSSGDTSAFGSAFGVYASASGTAGTRYGVFGTSNAGAGAVANYGVVGTVSGPAATNYGVFGRAVDAATNWAGYFDGNTFVSGNLGIGTFTPASKLDVAGIINTSSQYNIGGNRFLSNPGSLNLFAGVNAGLTNGSGAANTFVGNAAGRLNVNGGGNSYFGRAAGENSTGSGNSFVGVTAGQFATGSNNSYFGGGSGTGTSTAIPNTGNENSFFGYESGMVNTSGNLNAFFGTGSGRANTTGFSNAFFGAVSGIANVGGTANAFFGTESGDSNINGSGNSFFGYKAGDANTDGLFNVFVGDRAGQSNTVGDNNTIVGSAANVLAADLNYASAVGARANVGTSDTIVLGKVAGTYDGVARQADTVQIPGNLNVAGNLTGSFTVSAANITGVLAPANGGTGAPGPSGNFLRSNGATWASSAIQAGDIPSGSGLYIQSNPTTPQATSSFNIGGDGAANSFTVATQYNIGGSRVLSNSGANNLFAGVGAGNVNLGQRNSFVGKDAGLNNSNGEENSFFGSSAGYSNANQVRNTFVGVFAGQRTGLEDSGNLANENTFIGFQAGATNQTGSRNTAVGSNTSFSGFTGLVNATVIGANARVTQSNSLILGSINGNNGATADTNIGIGTTAPAAKLSVEANTTSAGDNTAYFRNAAIGSNISHIHHGTTGDWYIRSAASTGKVVLQDLGGNVGVGTPSPVTKLHVSGSGIVRARVNSDSNAGLSLALSDNPRWSIATVGGGQFQIFNEAIGTNAVWINSSNNFVGIGTPAPTHELSVNGNASKSVGGGSWAVFSDERLKNISGRYTRGLADLMRLNPIRYEYKPDNPLGLRGEGEYVGFSAQEVERILPEAVTRTTNGYLQINNDPIIWTMLNAVKEQQAQIEGQKKKIDALTQALCEVNPSSRVCNGEQK